MGKCKLRFFRASLVFQTRFPEAMVKRESQSNGPHEIIFVTPFSHGVTQGPNLYCRILGQVEKGFLLT